MFRIRAWGNRKIGKSSCLRLPFCFSLRLQMADLDGKLCMLILSLGPLAALFFKFSTHSSRHVIWALSWDIIFSAYVTRQSQILFGAIVKGKSKPFVVLFFLYLCHFVSRHLVTSLLGGAFEGAAILHADSSSFYFRTAIKRRLLTFHFRCWCLRFHFFQEKIFTYNTST